MRVLFFTSVLVFGCSLSGCVSELKAAGADQANPTALAAGTSTLATVTIQCAQSPDTSSCTVTVSSENSQAKAQTDSAESQDSTDQ